MTGDEGYLAEQRQLDVLWDSLSTPVYRVYDDEGRNLTDGRVRRVRGASWLYWDIIDGYEMDKPLPSDHTLVKIVRIGGLER